MAAADDDDGADATTGPRAVLERLYHVPAEAIDARLHEYPINFSVTLECYRDRRVAHMNLYVRDAFINHATNVCAMPMPADGWTSRNVERLLQVFRREYLPFLARRSRLVDEQYVVDQRLLYAVADGSSVRFERLDDEQTEDATVVALHRAVHAACPCRQRCWDEALIDRAQELDDGGFGLCDAFLHIDYTEAAYPFVATTDHHDVSNEWLVEMAHDLLPTVMRARPDGDYAL